MSNFNHKSQNFSHISCRDLNLVPVDTNVHSFTTTYPGTLRYNSIKQTFEGYINPSFNDQNKKNHDNGWVDLSLNIAGNYITDPNSKIGGVQQGYNLYMDSKGVLSSFERGISREMQNVITVSAKEISPVLLSDPNNNPNTGWIGKYYNFSTLSSIPTITHLKSLTPLAQKNEINLDFNQSNNWNNLSVLQNLGDTFASYYLTYFIPNTSEIFEFKTISNMGSQLYIDNVLLINNSSGTQSGSINLEAGKEYKIEVVYWSNNSSSSLKVSFGNQGETIIDELLVGYTKPYFTHSSDFRKIGDALTYLRDRIPADQGPSETNPYVILVSPGDYFEEIEIDMSYITIIGNDPQDTRIILDSQINSSQTNVIKLSASNLVLKNLTIESNCNISSIDNHNHYGILCETPEDQQFNPYTNIVFDNIKVKLNTIDIINTLNLTSLRLNNVSNCSVTNCEFLINNSPLINIHNNNNKNKCIEVLNKTSLKIKNSKLSVSPIHNLNIYTQIDSDDVYPKGNHYGIQTINSSLICDNLEVQLYGTLNSYGIFNFQSFLDISNSKINIEGGTQQNPLGYGIYNSDSFTETTLSGVSNTLNLIPYHQNICNNDYSIKFQNNTIKIVSEISLANNNFELLNRNFVVRIKNTSTNVYDGFYKINNVLNQNPSQSYKDTLILTNYYNFNENMDTGIIDTYYKCSVNNCVINSNKTSITCPEYYFLEKNIPNILSSPPNITGGTQGIKESIIIVGKEKSDFGSIYDALNSINDNSEFHR